MIHTLKSEMLSKFAWNEKIMQSFNEDQILPKNATANFLEGFLQKKGQENLNKYCIIYYEGAKASMKSIRLEDMNKIPPHFPLFIPLRTFLETMF